MKFHTILPELVLIIPFTLLLYYDMLIGAGDCIGNLPGHSEGLRVMIFWSFPGLSMNARGGMLRKGGVFPNIRVLLSALIEFDDRTK
jgi:hypothetical protein